MTKLKVVNPANNQIIKEIDTTDPQKVSDIVKKSEVAQKKWAKTSLEKREEMFLNIQKKLEEKEEELADLLTEEMGKPLGEARLEVRAVAKGMGKLVQEMRQALTEQIKTSGGVKSKVQYMPLGVAAVISPWNFPLAMPNSMVLPSLMAGNAVVLKPSEETPLIAQKYADILNEVLPQGVLQVIHGKGDVGAALVQAEVQLIVFTGSVATGKHILGEAAKDLKKVILELGGKDPLLVLDGADLNQATDMMVFNSLRNAGQVCVSTEKSLVLKKDKQKVEEMVVKKVEAFKVGDGINEVDMGPMIHRGQKDLVISQVEEAVSQGAKVLVGKLEEDKKRDDNFLSPIVLTNVVDTMRIFKEETFGPVVCITTLENEKEMVKKANQGEFGLGAIVMGPEKRAAEVANQIYAGMVGINKRCNGCFGTPWVGAKNSGYGYHKSIEGHRQFAQVRVVSVEESK